MHVIFFRKKGCFTGTYNSFDDLQCLNPYCDNKQKTFFLFIQNSMISHLGSDIFFQCIGTVIILGIWSIISTAVCKHSLHIRNEQSLVAIIIGFQSIIHGFQIHGIFYVIIIVWDHFSINGYLKWPRALIIFGGVQNSF